MKYFEYFYEHCLTVCLDQLAILVAKDIKLKDKIDDLIDFCVDLGELVERVFCNYKNHCEIYKDTCL